MGARVHGTRYQSDIPALDKLSWATGVVFGSVLLALCQSWLSWPCIIGIADWRVFGIQDEIGQSPPSQSASALGGAGGQSFDYLLECW